MAIKEKVCECGRVVKGLSEGVLDVNLETHKRGSKHKELMRLKEHWIKQGGKE